jgi:tubulin-specific chaperone cofactor E-like protein
LLTFLKRLQLLNLSSNPLPHGQVSNSMPTSIGSSDLAEATTKLDEYIHINEENDDDINLNEDYDDNNSFLDENNNEHDPKVKETLNYFDNEWYLNNNEHRFDQLKILILNSCYIELCIVQRFLQHLVNLAELHLSTNNYSKVTFTTDFVMPTLRILYFNENNLTTWSECCKLGRAFPGLENLVLSFNPIADFVSNDENNKSLTTTQCFRNLQTLILNKLKISEWTTIDQLLQFPSLKHVRIQHIPLLENYTEEEKYYLLMGHLDESIQSLNGSEIKDNDRENCERNYIRHYLDAAFKPQKYFQLEKKHGKLNKLANVNLDADKLVQVRIKYRDAYHFEKVDVRQTVGDFKKQLEKLVGYPSHRFRLFYIDIEALPICGPEELKYPNRCLHSFKIRHGDEFEIDIKPLINHHHHIHSTQSDSQFQINSSSQLGLKQSQTKPLVIRNRKVPTNENNAPDNRYYKKTKPGSSSLSSSSVSSNLQNSTTKSSLSSPKSSPSASSQLGTSNERRSFLQFKIQNRLQLRTNQQQNKQQKSQPDTNNCSQTELNEDDINNESKDDKDVNNTTSTHDTSTNEIKPENKVIFTTGDD